MDRYQVKLTKQAEKDLAKLKQAGLASKAKKIIDKFCQAPWNPPVEKLVGDLKGAYSRRLTIKHRIVYKIDEEKHMIVILSMWAHYE